MCSQEKYFTNDNEKETVIEAQPETSSHDTLGETHKEALLNNNCCQKMNDIEDKLAHVTVQYQEEKKQAHDWQQKYMFVLADLENFKKRTAKESSTVVYNVQSRMLNDIINIIDDFERAFESLSLQEKNDGTANIQGFTIIHKALEKVITQYGVSQMNNYDHFDPEFHEALAQVDNTHNQYQSGAIVKVLQKGYVFSGHVLRHAKVSVAQ